MKKFSVRLSKIGANINQLLKNNHSLNSHVANWGNINGCDLFYGSSYGGTPKWKAFIAAGTNAQIATLSNAGAAALLFLPIQNRYMIFSFGYGNHQLSNSNIERDFGLKVVLNTVAPDSIRSIDSKTLDDVVINRKTQVSKEKPILDFGFEVEKDFLKQIAGRPNNQNFATSIAGGDSLTIHCDLSPAAIVQKANSIYNEYLSTVYQANYGWIDNVKIVKDKVKIGQLDTELVTALNDLLQGNNNDLQIACPEVVDYDNIDHFKISGYRSTTAFPFIDVTEFINDLNAKGVTTLSLANVNSCNITAEDGNDMPVKNWKLYDWIIFSVSQGNSQYILSDREWFEISANYFNNVNAQFNNIINNNNEYLQLPTTTHLTETAYLTNYVAAATEKIFDRHLTYIYGGRNAVEICDLYNVNREFIHVKEGSSSAKLSHLFNQGFVSASLFLSDPNFRTDIISKLTLQPPLASTISNSIAVSNYTVVYRILKSGRNFTLPFFSKIIVNNVRNKIIGMGYKFRLEWLPKP